VSSGKSALDDVILAGADFKKHFSESGSATSLDGEMSATKRRYENLVNCCSERLARFEEALPVADTFHDMHDQLLLWLQRVEPDLEACKEPTGADAKKQLDVSSWLSTVFSVLLQLLLFLLVIGDQ